MKTITLDPLDSRIIHALYLDGRAPFSRLADVLGASEQTVARRYRQLRESGALRVVGQLNTQRLGQSDWAVRIHCKPDASIPVANALARRPDTAWVQLLSGGTEIFCTVKAHDERQRTALLLEQLPTSRQILSLQAHCLLHIFSKSASGAPGAVGLTAHEVERLEERSPAAAPSKGNGSRPTERVQDDDWPLIQALSDDGRATYRELAAQVHRHESTVRRRVEELMSAGTLYFDLDIPPEILGFRSRAVLWMSVAPSSLMAAATTLATYREVPFVAATTGPTNLVASLSCRDDYELFEFLTRQIATLDGVSHMEASPIIRSIKMHATITRHDE